MTHAIEFLAIFVIFFCFVYSGQAQCYLSNITVVQNFTRNFVRNKPEFEVLVKSACPCVQSQVQLDIKGFQTTEPIDPKILDKDGYLNNRMPLPSKGVVFKYAACNIFPFKPISSEISCS